MVSNSYKSINMCIVAPKYVSLKFNDMRKLLIIYN